MKSTNLRAAVLSGANFAPAASSSTGSNPRVLFIVSYAISYFLLALATQSLGVRKGLVRIYNVEVPKRGRRTAFLRALTLAFQEAALHIIYRCAAQFANLLKPDRIAEHRGPPFQHIRTPSNNQHPIPNNVPHKPCNFRNNFIFNTIIFS